ncbi:MAG: tetratricopeptide repeat protein, partial [Magnetococcales bacterium]|nr:tetratricopeptide repeat protein [Magnetococcales bacterium]
MKHLRLFACIFSVLASLMWSGNAQTADTLDEIYAIVDRKEFDTALKRLNLYLTQHPRDAQGRFLKGLILTETRQREQAIEVFLQLSKDFPELPEPYNNLAVLYAEQGHFDKAQEALTQAVKAHPNYATAHENLGDIHAKLASQSYARALKLNQGNTVLAGKLNKVKTLFAESQGETHAKQNGAVTTAKATTRTEPTHTAQAETPKPHAPAAPAQAETPKPQTPAAPAQAE